MRSHILPTIRPAAVADAVVIAELTNIIIRESTHSFKSQETTAALQASAIAEPGPASLVAYEGATFLGYATYFPVRRSDGYRHTTEHTIVLTDATRGQGIGRKLLTQLFGSARSAGIHSMFVGVSAENAPGTAFHRQLGFTELVRLPQVGRKFDR